MGMSRPAFDELRCGRRKARAWRRFDSEGLGGEQRFEHHRTIDADDGDVDERLYHFNRVTCGNAGMKCKEAPIFQVCR